MIEMRWLMTEGSYERVLQFRQRIVSSGELGAYSDWSEWQEVETFIQETEDGS